MYEASLAQNSYHHMPTAGDDGRGIEYKVFARITRELAYSDENAPDYHPKLNAALHKNLQLWSVLAVEVANDNNQLPAKLRSQIFYLAQFTRQHTAKVCAGEANAKVLVDINTMIMRGLRNTPVAAEEG